MARHNEELDIDFGLETSPKKLIKFIAFGLGGLVMLGAVGATAVYMTSPVTRQGQETAGRMPTVLGIMTAIASGGRMGVYDFDRTMNCAYKSLDVAMSSMQDMTSDLETISPSRRMQMERQAKESCERVRH